MKMFNQRKGEFKNNLRGGAVCIIVILMLFLAACSKSKNEAEDLIQNTVSETAQSEPQETGEIEPKIDIEGTTEATETTETIEATDKATDKATGTATDTAAEPDTAEKDVIANISGYIESVASDNFVISQTMTSKNNDGSELAIYDPENKTLITVYFTDTTEFIICSTSDGGITSSDSVGTKQNLIAGESVMIDGTWTDNDVQALKVTIYQFQ